MTIRNSKRYQTEARKGGKPGERLTGGHMNIEELKKLKAEAGLTSQELSELSGVPVSTVNKIFSGATKNPRYATLLALEEALRIRRKLPFTYNELTQEPSVVRESAAPYRYQARRYDGRDIQALSEHARAELIDGTLYMMSAPSRMHQLLVTNLLFSIQGHILANRGACQVYPSPFDVQLFGDESCTVQPDLLVVCRPQLLTPRGCAGAPDWIIEVASASNARHDYVTKMALYQRAGVKEYWIVDPEEARTLVMNFQKPSGTGEYGFDQAVPSGILEGLSICIGDFPGLA